MEKHADNWRKNTAQANARMKRQVNEKLASTTDAPKVDPKQDSNQLNEEEKSAIMNAKRRYRRVTKYIKTGKNDVANVPER